MSILTYLSCPVHPPTRVVGPGPGFLVGLLSTENAALEVRLVRRGSKSRTPWDVALRFGGRPRPCLEVWEPASGHLACSACSCFIPGLGFGSAWTGDKGTQSLFVHWLVDCSDRLWLLGLSGLLGYLARHSGVATLFGDDENLEFRCLCQPTGSRM